jgi:putative transposase
MSFVNMQLKESGIYHIYNRGNNRQQIFFREDNYTYYLQKCFKYIKPLSKIIAWCLMPNHFHFMMEITEKSLQPVRSGGILMPVLTNGFRLLQSSYAKGINKQEGRTGNLFQQKTKAKLIRDPEYITAAFNYIHNNPLNAGLVDDLNNWEYSSFMEYSDLRRPCLCNVERGKEILGIEIIDFNLNKIIEMDKEILKKIY